MYSGDNERELIPELEDPESDFDDVEPRNLLALIALNADPATILDAKELKELRDAPLVFDGDKNLTTQFSAQKSTSKTLPASTTSRPSSPR